MVVKNLFTGQQWRNRHRLMDMGRGEEWVRCMDIVTWKPTVKKKACMMISIDTRKTFDKIQLSFQIKALNENKTNGLIENQLMLCLIF